MPQRSNDSTKDVPTTKRSAPTAQANNPAQSGDAWEELAGLKSGGQVEDENGFTKMNTSFYLKDGEEIEIVLLEDQPYIFMAHTVKMHTKAGKAYFVTEACQKANSNHCEFCSTKAKTVGLARQTVAFEILDPRGTKDAKTDKWSNKPAPKIFLPPLALAKAIKRIRDDVGGSLLDKVLKLSKDSKAYSVQLSMTPGKEKGQMFMKKAPKFDGPRPDVKVIYAPLSDQEAMNIIGYAEKSDDGDGEDDGKDEPRKGMF